MIIFGPFTAFLPYIELGEISPDKNYMVFNLNSPVNYGIPLMRIFPGGYPGNIAPDEYQYDMWIHDYLNSSIDGFNSLMNLMYHDYNGATVIGLIDTAPWSAPQVESLIKYIQCRYGIEINLINDAEDFPYCKNSIYSQLGRQQFNVDKERFVYDNYDQFMMSTPQED